MIKRGENTYTLKQASYVTIKERECIRLENYTLMEEHVEAFNTY